MHAASPPFREGVSHDVIPGTFFFLIYWDRTTVLYVTVDVHSSSRMTMIMMTRAAIEYP
jgi:hypothetical protein